MKKVADFENITVNEAYGLPVMQLLNDLIYLKAKAQHDEQILKNARHTK